MSIRVLCHFITCFLLSGSLLIGLTRKDIAQVKIWNWVTRVLYAIMAAVGISMWIQAVQIATLNALSKCTLATISIVLMEVAYKKKKDGTLNKKWVCILVIALLLTIVCGFMLAIATRGRLF